MGNKAKKYSFLCEGKMSLVKENTVLAKELSEDGGRLSPDAARGQKTSGGCHRGEGQACSRRGEEGRKRTNASHVHSEEGKLPPVSDGGYPDRYPGANSWEILLGLNLLLMSSDMI